MAAGKRAYRIVLLADRHTEPQTTSQYTLVTTSELGVGDVIDTSPNATCWEVVEVSPETAPLVLAEDASGTDIPLAGTLVCKRFS